MLIFPDKKLQIITQTLTFFWNNLPMKSHGCLNTKDDLDTFHINWSHKCSNLPLNFNIHISCSLDNHLMDHETTQKEAYGINMYFLVHSNKYYILKTSYCVKCITYHALLGLDGASAADVTLLLPNPVSML